MTAGHLMLDDGELHCEKRGHGPPVVLRHGGGLSGVTWDRQFALSARDHTVIRYDARGHGESSPPKGPFAHHEDLGHVLDPFIVDHFERLWSLTPKDVDEAAEHVLRPTELPAIERVAEWGARTVVVVGDLDSADIHAVADLVCDRAPRAEKVVVEGAGHLVRFLSASR